MSAFLLLLLMAPTLADSQSVVGADRQTVPTWVHQLPVGDRYVYFRGDAEGEDYEKAKLRARSDVYRKAILWMADHGKTEEMRESLSRSDNHPDSMDSNLEVTFDPVTFKQIEWVADYSTGGSYASEYTWNKAPHHYYVLVRVKRPGRNFLVAIGQGVGGRVDAVFHSALYPGWGQRRQGRYGESGFFMGFGTLAGLAVGGLYVAETQAADTPDKTWNQDTLRRYRRGATYAFAGIYAANLVDALLFGREAHDYVPGGLSGVLGIGGEIGLRYYWGIGSEGKP